MLNRIVLRTINLLILIAVTGCGNEPPKLPDTDAGNAEPAPPAAAVKSADEAEPPPKTPTVEDCALILKSILSERLVTNDVVYGQAIAFKDGESLSRVKQTPPPDRIPSTQFSETVPRPNLAEKLIDCAVEARFVGEVTVEFKYNTKTAYHYEFAATHEQMEGLYKLDYNDQFTKAITWDKDRLHAGLETARGLPEDQRDELAEKWSKLQPTRKYVMELVHPAGTHWEIKGRASAHLKNNRWVFQLDHAQPVKRPDANLVTKEFFPEGLVAVNRGDYAASKDEWWAAYEEFLDEVTAAQEAAQENKKQGRAGCGGL